MKKILIFAALCLVLLSGCGGDAAEADTASPAPEASESAPEAPAPETAESAENA